MNEGNYVSAFAKAVCEYCKGRSPSLNSSVSLHVII